MIDAYSVPCAPDTTASTGPGLRAVDDGDRDVVAGVDTGRHVDDADRARCPREAVAVPTVKVGCASWRERRGAREHRGARRD